MSASASAAPVSPSACDCASATRARASACPTASKRAASAPPSARAAAAAARISSADGPSLGGTSSSTVRDGDGGAGAATAMGSAFGGAGSAMAGDGAVSTGLGAARGSMLATAGASDWSSDGPPSPPRRLLRALGSPSAPKISVLPSGSTKLGTRGAGGEGGTFLVGSTEASSPPPPPKGSFGSFGISKAGAGALPDAAPFEPSSTANLQFRPPSSHDIFCIAGRSGILNWLGDAACDSSLGIFAAGT